MTASHRTLSHPLSATGRPAREAARRSAAGLQHVDREHALMWELWWQASRASVPSTGPLTWVLTLDGHRLAGCHLPAAEDDAATGQAR